MTPTDQDWSLLHERARKIESSFPINSTEDLANALYWCNMTSQQLEYIKDKITKPNIDTTNKNKVKVF